MKKGRGSFGFDGPFLLIPFTETARRSFPKIQTQVVKRAGFVDASAVDDSASAIQIGGTPASFGLGSPPFN